MLPAGTHAHNEMIEIISMEGLRSFARQQAVCEKAQQRHITAQRCLVFIGELHREALLLDVTFKHDVHE